MKLPYADEIAKQRSLQRVVLPRANGYRDAQAAKTELDGMRGQVGHGVHSPEHLPGAEAVRAAASLHPDLADLESMFIGEAPLQECVIARSAQLDRAMQTLWPFVSESTAVEEALTALWLKQAEASAGPEHDEVKKQVAHRMAQQAHLAGQTPPLHQARSAIIQILSTIEYQVPLLETALIEASRSDDPRRPHNAAILGFEHRNRVLEIADLRNLELSPVPEPAVPDTPHGRHNRRLRREAAAVLAWMQTVAATQGECLATIENRLRDITEETTRIQAAVEELTG